MKPWEVEAANEKYIKRELKSEEDEDDEWSRYDSVKKYCFWTS
jgi:hypothetical protein